MCSGTTGSFTANSDEETEHEPHRRGRCYRCAQQFGVIECVGASILAVYEIEAQDCQQHKKAAGLGEDEELDCCIDPVLMAPYPDEEVHRHQHQFPEEVEEDQIQGQEDTNNPSQDHHEIEMKEPDAILYLFPGTNHRHDPEKDREQDQEETQTVHRKVKTYAQLGDPRMIHLDQPSALSGIGHAGEVFQPDLQNDREVDSQCHQRRPPGPPGTPMREKPTREDRPPQE